MKIEIEKKRDTSGEEFYFMVVNDTRNFVFDSTDKLIERLGDVLLEESNTKLPF